MTRTMGLDVGDRRIGVALSDPTGMLASPHTIIERQDELKDIEAILAIVSQNQVQRIIIGLPRSMSGNIGAQAEKVIAFAKALSNSTKVPTEFRDERLTTKEAQRLMQANESKKGRKKGRDDAIAAALILQGYLDEIRNV